MNENPSLQKVVIMLYHETHLTKEIENIKKNRRLHTEHFH